MIWPTKNDVLDLKLAQSNQGAAECLAHISVRDSDQEEGKKNNTSSQGPADTVQPAQDNHLRTESTRDARKVLWEERRL